MPSVLVPYAFMRFQVGYVEKRYAMCPHYEPILGDDNKIVAWNPKVKDYTPSETEMVAVFHVLGYGETKEKAWEMVGGEKPPAAASTGGSP